MYENKTIGSATKPAHTLSTLLHVETQKVQFWIGVLSKMCHRCRTFPFVATFHLINITRTRTHRMCSD